MKPNPAKIILWLAGIALLVAVMFLTPSCTSTKQITREKKEVDSTVLEEKSREVMRLQADTAEYRRQIREMEYLGVSFTDCPEVDTSWFRKLFSKDCPPDRVDSFIRVITPPPTTVRKGADGSLEIVSNRIAGVIQSNIRLVEEAASLRSRLLQLEKDSARMAAHVKKSESVTKKDVKRTAGPRISGLLIGLLIGLALGVWGKRKLDHLKNVKSGFTVLLLAMLVGCCPVRKQPAADKFEGCEHRYSMTTLMACPPGVACNTRTCFQCGKSFKTD